MIDGSDNDEAVVTKAAERDEPRRVARAAQPRASALSRRYGRSKRLVAGRRVKFTDEDGSVFTGTIAEVVDAEGERVLRVQLDMDPDAAPAEESAAEIVEVPARSCRTSRAPGE
jgi:hypothetical protein